MNLTIKKIVSVLRSLSLKDNLRTLRECDILFLCHNVDLSYTFRNKAYGQFIDSIYFLLSKTHKGEFVLLPFSNLESGKTFNEYKNIHRTFFFHFLCQKLLNLFTRKKNLNFEAMAWVKVLTRTKPKHVICIQPKPSLCLAAHKLNIPIYDFQHGVISQTDVFYGKEFRKETPKECLPSSFLVWNDESASVLRQWTDNKDIKVYIIGNPWTYRFTTPIADDLVVKESIFYKEDLSKKMRILITLQWGLSIYYPFAFKDENPLHPCLVKTISETSDLVDWHIRIHPITLKNEKEKSALLARISKLKGVQWEWATRNPLPLILNSVDGHVTWDSNTISEAASLGIPSFMLNPGSFSTVPGSRSHVKVSSELYKEIPYQKEEAIGLLQRKSNLDNNDDLKFWVQNVSSLKQKSNVMFNYQRLKEIFSIQ